MAEETHTKKNESLLSEIQNMKVADLKKKLKSFGLPASGNKMELIERLQEACSSGKNVTPVSESEGATPVSESEDVTPVSEPEGALWLSDDLHDDLSSTKIDEDVLQDNDEFLTLTSPESESSKVLGHAETDANISFNSSLSTKPLKKRIVAETSSESSVVKKKIHLNRNTFATATVLNSVRKFPVKVTNVITYNKDKDETKADKTISEFDKLAMRAKRFNVKSAAANTKSEKSVGNVKPVTLSNPSRVTELEVFKKRGQRFGENVSPLMKQIEEKDKLLKRKMKFGAEAAVSVIGTLDEQEKKKKRAERFGI